MWQCDQQCCGDGGTDENAGGGDGGGRVEDVTISVRKSSVMSTSEERRRSDGLGRKHDREASLMWFGHAWRKYDGYIEEGCRRWNCQERGHGA